MFPFHIHLPPPIPVTELNLFPGQSLPTSIVLRFDAHEDDSSPGNCTFDSGDDHPCFNQSLAISIVSFVSQENSGIINTVVNRCSGEWIITFRTTIIFTLLNNLCSEALPIDCGDITEGSTINATANGALSSCQGPPGSGATNFGNGVWYGFTGTGDTMILSTDHPGTDFDTELQLWSGICGSLTCVGGDDNGGAGTTSILKFKSEPGTPYILYADGNGLGRGKFELSLTCPPPPNDGCAGAIVLPTVDSTCMLITANTGNASDSGTHPNCDNVGVNIDLWYVFQAPATGAIQLERVNGSSSALIEGAIWNACGGAIGEEFYCDVEFNDGDIIFGLNPDSIYYLQFWIDDFNPHGDFQFCLKALPPTPANDTCNGAFDYITSFGPIGDFNSQFSNQDSSDMRPYQDNGLDPTCDIGGDATSWYTWVATDTILNFCGGSGFPGLEVLKGSCGSFNSIGCLNNTSGAITGLEIDSLYYLLIWDDNFGSSDLNWNIFTGVQASHPSCGDYVDYPLCQFLYPPNDTQSFVICPNEPHNRASITFTFFDIENGYDFVEIKDDGNSVATLTGFGLADSTFIASDTGQCLEVIFTSDEIVQRTGFSFIVNCPSNDICQGVWDYNAAFGPIGGPGSAIGNTDSLDMSVFTARGGISSCGFGDDATAWFTWTATHTWLSFESKNGYPGLEVFAGNCDSLNSLGCSFGDDFIDGLEIGETYYLLISDNGVPGSSNVTWSIEGFTPPPNDTCAGALDYNATFGSIGGAGSCANNADTLDLSIYTDSGLKPSCDFGGDATAWYVWTATYPYLKFRSGAGNPGLEVFEGSCGGLVSVDCAENIDGVIGQLSIGTTYYFLIWDDGLPGTEVNWCLEGFTPQINDICAGAFNYNTTFGAIGGPGSSLNNIDSLDMSCYTDNRYLLDGSPTCDGDEDAIAWYTWTATHPWLRFYSGNDYPGLEVLDGSCGSLNSLGCLNSSDGAIGGLSIGSTYYLVIWDNGFGANNVSWAIEGFTPPPNDTCATAFDYNAAFGPIGGPGSCPLNTDTLNLNVYTNLGVSPTCRGSDATAWYTWTAVYPWLSITTGQGSPTIEVFEGGCGGLNSIACLSYGASTNISGLTVGSTYYILISDYIELGSTEVTWCMQGFSPPVNDICAGAFDYESSFGAIGNFIDCESNIDSLDMQTYTWSGTSGAGGLTCDGFGNASIAWYTWIATDSVLHFLSLAGEPGLEVMSGSCGSLVSHGCLDNESGTIQGLTIGSTYYIIIWDDDIPGASMVTWKLYTIAEEELAFNPFCGDTVQYPICEDQYGVFDVKTFTICPSGADTASITFTYFDIEVSPILGGTTGMGCWDYVEIFDDGLSLGTYCSEASGSGKAPSDSSSDLSIYNRFVASDTGHCLSVVFHSDINMTRTGFEFIVDNCIDCPPVRVINGAPEAGSFYAGTIINSDAVIESPKGVIYHSGDEINLNENFEVELGAEFDALIDDCP